MMADTYFSHAMMVDTYFSHAMMVDTYFSHAMMADTYFSHAMTRVQNFSHGMTRVFQLTLSNYKLLIFIILFISQTVFSVQNNSTDDFFTALIYKQKDISNYVDPDELLRSGRLGITYEGVINKFLISYDIDSAVKRDIIEKHLVYQTNEIEKDGEYTKIDFSVPVLAYSKNFYFKSGKFISPATYYSRKWKSITGKYFIFKISAPEYFNDYCVQKLDGFVEDMADKLGFTDRDKQLLQKEKIYYILCKDADEIKKVSGFDMRGQYLTAFDEILTTYNTHYHELCHLLINYRLKKLTLYTLPFFLEGFAVALGGRGGMSPRVVMDAGLFLQKKGIMTYSSIIGNDSFYNEDASLTYPVAGLYNLFLINTVGMDAYLDLYRKMNGELSYIAGIKSNEINLPDDDMFEQFLIRYMDDKRIILNDDEKPLSINDDLNGNISDFDSCYYFNVKGHFLNLYPATDYKSEFKSKIFEEVSKNNYLGENYLISADSTYIKIYNCFNNELLESYDLHFSIENKNVPVVYPYSKHGEKYFAFRIKKSLFDMDFKLTR